jgi:hypothetical protein
MDDRPVSLVLHHLLERPGDGPLLGIESAIEIETILVLDVPADEGGIRDALTVILDIGQLALGRLAEAVGVGAVREPAILRRVSALSTNGLGSGRPNAGPKV